MWNLNQIKRFFLYFIIFHFITLSIQPISSFSLHGFNNEQNPDFISSFALLGDAKIANGGIFINLTSPSLGSGTGQIVYKKPFKFLDSKSLKPVSFSTEFTFLISPDDGDGLAFVIFPSRELTKVFDQGLFGISDNNVDGGFVAIEYDTREDVNVGDLNGNHVGIDVGRFVSDVVSDVSNVGLVLNNGESLRSWIDYEASSKRLEVRLGGYGGERPLQPLISYAIDLGKMWGDREVFVGISSASGDSRQMSSLSSWSFSVRTFPSSLHSQPLNPDARQKKSSFLTVLGTLIFATGCGTLVAFFVLFLWVVFYGRHSNVAPELPLNPVEFKYEKVNVTVDNVADDSTS